MIFFIHLAQVSSFRLSKDIGSSVQKTGGFYDRNGEFSDVWKGMLRRMVDGAEMNTAVSILSTRV